MKRFFLILALAGVFMACRNGNENSADTNFESDSSMVTSTTPPPTADTTSPIGVMMGDTTTIVYDSVAGGQD